MELMSLIHEVNPYKDFDASRYPVDLQGWHGEGPVFGLLMEAQPKLVIEVGTWKGQSAVTMAKQLPPGGKLLCIDTWLGSKQMWLNRHSDRNFGCYNSLKLHHGYPTVYYQFLANIVNHGLQDVVIPFPQHSVTAARILTELGVRAQLIYIDGSHEQGDVFADLRFFWPLLEEGGVMFGDDVHSDWQGVTQDVNTFSAGKRIEFMDRFWILRK